jgi:hypothetical protein
MEKCLLDVEYNEDVERLNYLKNKIDSLDHQNQVEILRIIVSSQKISINENKYGIHINLTELPVDTINEIKIYLSYIKKQEEELIYGEQKRNDFKNIFFNKEDKEK